MLGFVLRREGKGKGARNGATMKEKRMVREMGYEEDGFWIGKCCDKIEKRRIVL